MSRGVILYGPPASGKDTIADLLGRHPGYEKFKLFRTGPAKPESYRHIELSELDKRTDLLWRNDKYNATYAIDKTGIDDVLSRAIAIVQLGEPVAVKALRSLETKWFVVALWCDREEARNRLESRGTVDIADRLKVWDKTKSIESDLDFRTDDCTAEELTHSLLESLSS